MRKILLNYVLLITMLFASGAIFAQSKITGTVVDAETGEGLPGASVVLKGTSNGTITDINGDFLLLLNNGETSATVQVSFVGFTTIEQSINLNETTAFGKLEMSAGELTPLEIIASVAVERKTPVAVSTINKEAILERASNQEFPELLKTMPGVYATKQGGGYGDSRVNIRGFNSENVAVMINGVPVNDMENGTVYWSNWAGLTDVTKDMQVQRGLGASRVAVPSIGGTINVLTQNTDAQKGGNVYYGIGNNNYQKKSFYVSTGLNEKGWALSLSGAKTSGDGYVDGTMYVGYNYFINISKRINDKHMLSFTGFGAPQEHGQRQYKNTIQTYRDSGRGIRFNGDWGYLDGQKVSVQNNFYHKPQFQLNHYWTINNKTELTTAAYVSIGTGGGGGGSNLISRSYDGLADLDSMRSINVANRTENGGDGSATGFLYASMNNHRWYGLLSTLTTQLTPNLTFMGGLDLRYYKGIHYGKITNLLGAEYYLDNEDINNPYRMVKENQKYSYYYDGEVMWQGLFGQAEYSQGDLSAFLTASVSNTSYRRVDFYQYYPGDQKTDYYSYLGYQVKGGANYNLTAHQNVFFNAGYFTKAPQMSAVFPNYDNTANDGAKLQRILSFELGYGYKSGDFSANLNVYRTAWFDRTLYYSVGNNFYANLIGVDAVHQGIELEMKYRISQPLTISGMMSLGDWRWANDLKNVSIYTQDRQLYDVVNLYIKGLKVGNSAQTTASVVLDYRFFSGFKIGAVANYYGNNWANYDPEDRTDSSDNSTWKIPDYYNMDLNANYSFKVGNLDATVYGNVNNLFDTHYITDAQDASTVSAVTVWYGTGRQWTAGLRVKF